MTQYRDRSRNLPRMTRAHFEALAAAFRNVPAGPSGMAQFEACVAAVSDVCQRSNPAFNAETFRSAIYNHEA